MTASPSQPCPNCGEPAASPFCPTCGESQTPPLLSVGAWLRETASELLAVDGRVFRTLRALLFSPGTLDQEWARGRRRPYLGPTRLYLIAAAFLFFAAALVPEQGSPIASFASGWMQGGTSDQLSPLAKAEAVDKVAGWVEASLRWLLLFGMVPALAGLSRLLLGRRGDYFAQHITASLHIHAVMFLLLGVLLLTLKALGLGSTPDATDIWGMAVVQPLVLVSALVLYRRVFRRGWPSTVLRLAGVYLGYMTVMVVVAAAMVLAAAPR